MDNVQILYRDNVTVTNNPPQKMPPKSTAKNADAGELLLAFMAASSKQEPEHISVNAETYQALNNAKNNIGNVVVDSFIIK